ncbi:10068_t:CDS:1, partial [Funneliformis mosseae]
KTLKEFEVRIKELEQSNEDYAHNSTILKKRLKLGKRNQKSSKNLLEI